MELKIYNQEIQLTGIIDSIQSLIWHRCFYQPGDFEMILPFTSHHQQLLVEQHYITKDESGEFGIIESIEIEQSEDGDWIKCSGRFGPSLLARRIIFEQITLSNTVETVMHSLVNLCCIEPEDSKRVIPYLFLGELVETAINVSMQVTYKNLCQTLYQLVFTHQLGFDLHLDPLNKKLIFKCHQPIDRSHLQSIVSKVVFSSNYENIRSSHYIKNQRFIQNCALVGGQGEGDQRVLVLVGDAQGINRYEVFVNAKDQRWDDELSEQEYLELLIQRGWQAIQPEIECFESDVVLNGSVRYHQDFDLGDTVTIEQPKWNKQIAVQITEISEVFDELGQRVIPIFGQSISSISTQSIVDTSGSTESGQLTLISNKTVITDSAGQLTTSIVSPQELASLSGIQSSVQTQLNEKQPTITGAASTIASNNLSNNQALISNGSGKVAVSVTTSSELGYLSGVTSAIQTQLNNKAATSHTHSSSQITDFLNKVYPVGAIFLSTVSTSPATLFGGTWARIQDRFLLAAGSTYGAATTGGGASHSHTSAAHKHGAGFESGGDGDLWATVTGGTGNIYFREDGTSTTWTPTHRVSGTYGTSTNNVAGGADIRGYTSTTTPGSTGSSSSLPPYLSVYVWQRTA